MGNILSDIKTKFPTTPVGLYLVTWLAQMGEQRPAKQDVVDSNPGWTNMIMLWFETLSQLRLTDLVPHILFSLPKIEGEVKETTLLFE